MINLKEYGFDDAAHREGSAGLPARVTAVHRERYGLVCPYGPTFGRLKTGAYHGADQQSIPTVGDFVLIDYNTSGDSLIVETLPRTSFFRRRDPSPGRGGQAVAANFDFVFVMASLNQNFNVRRLERTLALAFESGATPVIILTKLDLAPDSGAMIREAEKSAPGITVHAVSACTGEGLGALSPYLSPGRTLVFLGSSGVGKSSLLNALAGEARMAVGAIREEDGRGRHTTSARQLVMLSGGAMIIDTPGMRELGMWDVNAGLEGVFADVESLIGSCRFGDCRHENEPGCAVRRAIEGGALSEARWESYLKLRKEAKYSEDKASAMREKEEWCKNIAKLSRQLKKGRS